MHYNGWHGLTNERISEISVAAVPTSSISFRVSHFKTKIFPIFAVSTTEYLEYTLHFKYAIAVNEIKFVFAVEFLIYLKI